MKTEPTSDKNRIYQNWDLRDESGIALLMSLGVMSLLIVLSLSFALTTMNSMKSVELSQDIVKARLFDESGFQKVYGLLSSNLADPNDKENLFPATKPELTTPETFPPQYVGPQPWPGRFNSTIFDPSDWGGRAYWFSVGIDSNGFADRDGFWEALQVDFAGKNFIPDSGVMESVLIDPDPANQVGWIHILDSGQDYPANDTPIVARIAYLIVDESGKIDPWEIVETDTAESAELRVGREVGEINLAMVIPSFPSLTSDFEKDSQGGFASDTRKWTSYYNIYRTFDENGTNLTQAQVDEIQKNLFPFSYDIEAFFDGVDDKHRFNVGANTDSPLWWDFLPGNKIDSILTPASDFSGDNTGGIPWLSITYNDAASSDSPIAAQVASNLIDFCDTDSLATFNITDATIPFYCGNEKVPYINEVKFEAKLSGASSPWDLDLKAEVEFVNMYDVNLGSGGTVTVDIAILSNGIVLHPNVQFTKTGLPNTNSQQYKNTGPINPTVTPTVTANPLPNFTIQINSIKFTDGTSNPDNVWDYAFDEPLLDNLNVRALLDGTKVFVSAEVNDPRNNFDKDEWTWAVDDDTNGINDSPANWTTTENNAGTINEATNRAFNIAGNPTTDEEPGATDPWDVSTSYIRNSPMVSLWELGAIHRGASWQTINLNDYNDLFIQQVATNGLGVYQPSGGIKGGDANILSQVKLSSDTEVYGRVNINTYNSDVLSAIFSGIVVGEDYENSLGLTGNNKLGETGTNSGTPATLATNTLTVNGLTGGEPFRFRAQIATIPAIADDSVITQLDTDRSKEEVIGKIANLLTTRQNYFSAIITSQIVKDMITGYQGGTRGVFDDGTDEILSEQRLSAILYRDAINNEFEVIRYEYLDE